MFDNAGNKIKALSMISFWITFIGISLIILSTMDGINSASLLSIVIVFFATWLTHLGLFAFGELCENVYEINKMMRKNSTNNPENKSLLTSNTPVPNATHISNKNSDTVTCMNCGKQTDDDSKYCIHCGYMVH